ncbi:hypothetical protein TNCV_4852511 [Trichonephila clavipes]|nr:hypothetical protein TNCV_4852511 [Trichonephila clavipes]
MFRCTTSRFAVALSDIQVIVQFNSIPVQFRGKTPWGSVSPLSLPLPSTSREASRWLFCVSQCRKGTIHLQTSMHSPGFKPRPSGTTGNVANYYIGRVTIV